MELRDLFTIKSKAQRKREAQKYADRIFHLGEGHRQIVIRSLRELVEEEKTDEELLYAYVCAKDFYLQDQDEDRGKLQGWYDRTYMYPEDKKRIIELVKMEEVICDLTQYPAVCEVRKRAKQQCGQPDSAQPPAWK